MAIDYKKLFEQAEKRLSVNSLQLLILGASGSGKSSLSGTTGKKTLYLHTASEAHGAKAARTYGSGNVLPVMVDEDRTPDEALSLTLEILGDVEYLKKEKFGAVVIDGATEFEAIIRASKRFKDACKTKDGGHNNFAEPTAVLGVFREIFAKLRRLSDEGIDYIMTCILDVKSLDSEDGSLHECVPKLSTYSVAEGICQVFPDIITVGRMTNPEGKVAHRIQFGTSMSKASKDARGNVKKLLNFVPRLTGVETLPEHMKADLKEVIKMKSEKVVK